MILAHHRGFAARRRSAEDPDLIIMEILDRPRHAATRQGSGFSGLRLGISRQIVGLGFQLLRHGAQLVGDLGNPFGEAAELARRDPQEPDCAIAPFHDQGRLCDRGGRNR